MVLKWILEHEGKCVCVCVCVCVRVSESETKETREKDTILSFKKAKSESQKGE
jgi:hypothetical protein